MPDAGETGSRPLRHHTGRPRNTRKTGCAQAAFIAEQAAQSGYSTNGMIMAAKALLAQTPHPTPEQIRRSLAGNLADAARTLES